MIFLPTFRANRRSTGNASSQSSSLPTRRSPRRASRSLRAVAAGVAVAALTAVAPLAAPTAAAEPAGAAAPTCPATAIIAARGSEQNGSGMITPTTYGANPTASNGYEGPNIRGLLLEAEKQNQQEAGTSLLTNVPVIGLDAEHYPAAFPLPPLAEEGEDLTPTETLQRLAVLLSRQSPLEIVNHSITEFLNSARVGIPGTMQQVAEYEAASGCKPKYVLIGYSQGSFVLGANEQELARRGQLGGVISIGNPAQILPGHSFFGAYTPNRTSYCLHGDIVCAAWQVDPAHAVDAMTQVHDTYFITPHPGDADALRTMRHVIANAATAESSPIPSFSSYSQSSS